MYEYVNQNARPSSTSGPANGPHANGPQHATADGRRDSATDATSAALATGGGSAEAVTSGSTRTGNAAAAVYVSTSLAGCPEDELGQGRLRPRDGG